MEACLGNELAEVVHKSRVFVVGTGGIGCELVKNLVLTGFQDIVMVSTRVRVLGGVSRGALQGYCAVEDELLFLEHHSHTSTAFMSENLCSLGSVRLTAIGTEL